MKIHLISDIHLELATNGPKTIRLVKQRLQYQEVSNAVLVLAGDIGKPTGKLYRMFLQEMSSIYAHVIIITGNHEYYQTGRFVKGSLRKFETKHPLTMQEVDAAARKVASEFSNVHFLQRESIVLDGVRFLGCTLWSRPQLELASTINDFTYIPEFEKNPKLFEDLHEADVKWLSETLPLKSDEYNKTVVITHHLPSFKLVSEGYQNNPKNVFYASDLEHLMAGADVWLAGHTHVGTQLEIASCRCYVNPLGYAWENTIYRYLAIVP